MPRMTMCRYRGSKWSITPKTVDAKYLYGLSRAVVVVAIINVNRRGVSPYRRLRLQQQTNIRYRIHHLRNHRKPRGMRRSRSPSGRPAPLVTKWTRETSGTGKLTSTLQLCGLPTTLPERVFRGVTDRQVEQASGGAPMEFFRRRSTCELSMGPSHRYRRNTARPPSSWNIASQRQGRYI